LISQTLDIKLNMGFMHFDLNNLET
jgi:hypothetical protein